MTTSGSSNDTRNFQCVTVASVGVIKLPLRDILASHIQPKDLFQKIQSCSTTKLRPDQLKLCFVPPPDVPDYNTFDVTLLYTLIRNLCSLPCPAQGWGKEPKANDTQISDDIERLRLFRNNYYAHAQSAVISDAVFRDVWKNLKIVFRRIQPKTGCSVDYEEELLNIERKKFTDDYLATFRVLLEALAKLEKQTDCKEQPDIIIQGENEITCGDEAQIEAEVNNVECSCWSIAWQKRRGDVIKCIDTSMKKYSGSTKKKLVINDVSKEDEGEYQAVLSLESNGPEYKSRNAIRLYAVGEIPFLNILKVTSGSDGITIHFNCGVLEQSPKLHLIEWSKNGQQLDNKSNKYFGEGINNRHLTITSPTYEDRGNYNCKVSNAVGSVSKNVMLDVPSVELLEISPTLCGSKTTLKSVISSTPTPGKIEWQTSKDGVDFHSIRKAKYFDNTDSFFVIYKATFADKLYYRLLVWNGIGETISNTVYLNVTGSPPNIKTIPETNIRNRSVKLIGNVIIYDDSPGVKNFFWTRNYKTIDFEECAGKLLEENFDNPSLTITNVIPDDAGEYRLIAMNDVGSCTSEAIVLGVPRVSEEKVEDEDNGGQWITVTIKSIPEPCHVQWSAKRKEEDTFTPIDINAEEYKGTTISLPHPMLFVKQKDQLEKMCFRIEVTNFIGNTQQDISGNDTTKQRKIDSVENTIYNDDGKIFEFTILSSTLVKQFPLEKLDRLKFLIKNSNKVKNLTSVKEATSVLECIEILQDENLFTPTDVIYMQFLCQEADCFDLFTKCIEYAECEQRPLCYFKKQSVNGYKDVQCHVQGDVSVYTKDYINHVIKTVAVILRCKEEDVLLNGAQHSKSFLISLSIKEPYVRKLLALEEKDRLKLRRLNIDYLIIDEEILDLEIPKDQGIGRKEQSSCKEVTPVLRLLQQEKNQPHGEVLEDSSDNWFTDAKMSVNRDHNKDDKTDEDSTVKLLTRCMTMDPEYSLQDVARCHLCETPMPLFHCDIWDKNICKDCEEQHLLYRSTEHKAVPYQMRSRSNSDQKADLNKSSQKIRTTMKKSIEDRHRNSLPSAVKQKNKKLTDRHFGSLSALSDEDGSTIDLPDVESSPLRTLLIDEPRIISAIKTEYGELKKELHMVSCGSDGNIWTCGNDNMIRLYTPRGDFLRSIQTKTGNKPDDIAVTKSGDLVYIDISDSTVNIVKETEIQTLIILQGLTPRCVCNTSTGDLLVIMEGENYSHAHVVRYSGSTEKQRFPYLFGNSIKYITENKNLDICVADCKHRAVVVFNQAGFGRFTYTGHHSNTTIPFFPYGITTDSQSRILTADFFNECIHILDQDGQFLRYIKDCMLFRYPWGLCVDTNDTLFVAESDAGKVKRIQYSQKEIEKKTESIGVRVARFFGICIDDFK